MGLDVRERHYLTQSSHKNIGLSAQRREQEPWLPSVLPSPSSELPRRTLLPQRQQQQAVAAAWLLLGPRGAAASSCGLIRSVGPPFMLQIGRVAGPYIGTCYDEVHIVMSNYVLPVQSYPFTVGMNLVTLWLSGALVGGSWHVSRAFQWQAPLSVVHLHLDREATFLPE